MLGCCAGDSRCTAYFLQAFDFPSGAEGDRTPDLMTARLGRFVSLSETVYSRV